MKDTRFVVPTTKKTRATLEYLTASVGAKSNMELWNWMLDSALWTVETVRKRLEENQRELSAVPTAPEGSTEHSLPDVPVEAERQQEVNSITVT